MTTNLRSSISLLNSDTTGRWQSKTLILSTNVDQKSLETVFLNFYLSPNWPQMAIKSTVSSDLCPRSSIVKRVFDCRLPGLSEGIAVVVLKEVLYQTH